MEYPWDHGTCRVAFCRNFVSRSFVEKNLPSCTTHDEIMTLLLEVNKMTRNLQQQLLLGVKLRPVCEHWQLRKQCCSMLRVQKENRGQQRTRGRSALAVNTVRVTCVFACSLVDVAMFIEWNLSLIRVGDVFFFSTRHRSNEP